MGAPLAGRRVAGFPVWDVVLAVALCVVAVAGVVTGNPSEGPLALTLPVAVVMTLAVAWRTRSPAVAVALVVAAGLAQTVLSQSPGALWALVVDVLVMYSVAAVYPEGRAAVAGLVLVGALLLQERIDNGVDYLFVVLLFGGTWLLGRASRLWRTRVTRAERHQHDLARLAVSEERLRIARELHDIVAHSLTVIAVQADAAEGALERDPGLARAPLHAITTTARGSLQEMRDMLLLLRQDEDVEPDGPVPGLEALDELLERARQSGLRIDADIDPPGEPLPPVVDLAAYRILQESLTNAAKHAGAVTVRVTVRRSADRLDLEVVNGPGRPVTPPVGTGMGLLGIRERAAAVGGSIDAGRTADGGFRVGATLPLGRDER